MSPFELAMIGSGVLAAYVGSLMLVFIIFFGLTVPLTNLAIKRDSVMIARVAMVLSSVLHFTSPLLTYAIVHSMSGYATQQFFIVGFVACSISLTVISNLKSSANLTKEGKVQFYYLVNRNGFDFEFTVNE